jgi:hypothetical protein
MNEKLEYKQLVIVLRAVGSAIRTALLLMLYCGLATDIVMAYTNVYANSLEVSHATDSQDFHE